MTHEFDITTQIHKIRPRLHRHITIIMMMFFALLIERDNITFDTVITLRN